MKTSRTIHLSLSVLALACACAPEDVQGPDTLQLETGWELTANPVSTTREPAPLTRDVIKPTAEDMKQHAVRAREDKTWYAANGQRYSALLVLENGLAYGRLGEAADRDASLAAPSRGDIEDAIDLLEDLDQPTIRKERIWTDTTIDNRSRISSEASLNTFPSRVIGVMTADGDVGDGGCTGAKVGPRHVLTASHCVMTADGTIRNSGFFNPGQTNSDAINGSIPWSGVFLRDWRNGREYDYALIYLQNTSQVASTGYMGVAYWNSESGYEGRNATLRGYPCGPNRDCGQTDVQRCAASPRNDKRCDGWMYTHTAELPDNMIAGNQLRTNNDGSSGQSGSPIYGTVNGSNGWIFGVYWGSDGSGQNRGARFRAGMWNDICSWIAQYPSSFVQHPGCN